MPDPDGNLANAKGLGSVRVGNDGGEPIIKMCVQDFSS